MLKIGSDKYLKSKNKILIFYMDCVYNSISRLINELDVGIDRNKKKTTE